MSNSGGVVQGSGRKGSGLPRRFFVRGAQEKTVRYFSPWTGFVVGRDGIRTLAWLDGKYVAARRMDVSGAQCAALWQKATCWEPGWLDRVKVWRDLDVLFIEETGREIGGLGSGPVLPVVLAPGVYMGLVKSGRGRGRQCWIFVGDGQ
jgi:hypothetical protein